MRLRIGLPCPLPTFPLTSLQHVDIACRGSVGSEEKSAEAEIEEENRKEKREDEVFGDRPTSP